MPEKFLAQIKVKNANDIVHSKNQSLNSMMLIKDENGIVVGKNELPVKALLTILINDTLDFFSISNNMSANQLASTINLLLEEYSLYKIDFFVFAFNNAKKGFYGKTFNRIDGQIIFEWCALADMEFTKATEEERILEKKKLLNDRVKYGDYCEVPEPKDRPVPMPEYVKEAIVKIGQKEIIKSVEREMSEEQILINSYIKDFNKIFDDIDDGSFGKRFIKVNNKMMDVSEYIHYRAELENN